MVEQDAWAEAFGKSFESVEGSAVPEGAEQ